MTQIEKIKVKIEKLRDYQISCIKNNYRLTGKPEENIILECNKLLSFINSLQAEPVSEELEEAVDGYIGKVLERTNCLIGNQPVGEEISKAIKFGAKWQKEQMLKAAVEGTLSSTITGSEQIVSAYAGYGEYGKDGDKVKLIILRTEYDTN